MWIYWYLVPPLVIILLAIGPGIPMLICELLGIPAGHEGNNPLAVLPWFLMFTVPAGVCLLVVWLLVIIVRLIYIYWPF